MITDFTLPDQFKCPYCQATGLHLEVDEWEEGGIPTEEGCHVSCENESDDGPDHYEMPYVFMLPLQKRVYEWARQNIRITEDEEDIRKRWRAFEQGEPIRC